MLDIRYPPYTPAKMKKFSGMSELKPNFDRNGKVYFSWLGWVFGLGADSKKGGLMRWAVLIAGVFLALTFFPS
jgi:beta-apo-4'-carotenal oxygenase